MFAQYKNGVVVGLFPCAQPDALDGAGNVICPGIPTIYLAEGHADLLAYFVSMQPKPPTKLQRIAAALAPYKLERISIQMIVGMAEMRADLTALQTNGATTRAADLANSFTRNTAYRVARTLENACLGIEAEV